LSNVERHTGVTGISIELQEEGPDVILVVEDDGKSIAEGRGGGESLEVLSIRERAFLLGGSASVVAPPGGGTTVRVRLPSRRTGGTP
jgi:signal transduction histidine kinase